MDQLDSARWCLLVGTGLLALFLFPPPGHGSSTPDSGAILGHTIRCPDRPLRGSTRGNCRLINLNDTPGVLFRGTRTQAQQRLIERLRRTHGDGRPNLPFRTLGGKQFWADVFIHDNWRIQENVFTDQTRLLNPSDVRKAWGSYEGTRTYFEELRHKRNIQNDGSHLVLLVHGIFRSKDSMAPLKQHLSRDGLEVTAVNYPSTQRSIPDHARQLNKLLNHTMGIQTVSFVTHSMGGLIVRSLVGMDGEWQKTINVNGIVMMAPPNQGAKISNSLKDLLPYQLITGESGQDLTSEAARNLPVPEAPVGIIAGINDGNGYHPLLDGRNDLTVTVESTRIEGQDDFMTIESIHSFMMNDPEAIEATSRFINTGAF